MSEMNSAERREAIRNCWFLTGATASGKTCIGLSLAQQLNAEIISMDSMALYRGMDIGTAKPTPSDRELVRHHMVDIVAPDQLYSVADYCAQVWDLVDSIRSAGKQVLFVGGTPLYLKSLLRGLFDGPPANWEVRRQIEQEVAERGIEALRERLEMVDPLTAHKLHPNDKRRMIRALEVYRQTGQPISHHQRQFDEGMQAGECRVFVLHWERPILHRRIEERVNSMFESGLVEEVRGLIDEFGQLSQTAEQAVGYREVLAHLRDDIPLEETQEAVKTRTRQFARRQETWFRGLQECRWVELADPIECEQIATEIRLSETAVND